MNVSHISVLVIINAICWFELDIVSSMISLRIVYFFGNYVAAGVVESTILRLISRFSKRLFGKINRRIDGRKSLSVKIIEISLF
jgi:hypothetical protein